MRSVFRGSQIPSSPGGASGFVEPSNGVFPDNEPSGLSAVYVNAPATGRPSGTVIDGDEVFFDYSSSGGGDIGSEFSSFGVKWDGTSRVTSVAAPGSRYGNAIRKKFFIGDTSGFNGLASDTSWAEDYEEIYFRTIFKLSANWQHENAGDKLFYWG